VQNAEPRSIRAIAAAIRLKGRAISQAVSRRPLTAAALGQVFAEYFGFPCQFSLHQLLHTHLSSGAGTIGQLVADVPNGLSLTPPHEIKKKMKKEVEMC
jgi:hypothetical protein